MIRNIVFRMIGIGDNIKDDPEDRHHQRGLQDGPGDAEQRLLVAYLDVAPGQEVKQIAELPELGEVDELPAGGRTNDGGRRVGVRCGIWRIHHPWVRVSVRDSLAASGY